MKATQAVQCVQRCLEHCVEAPAETLTRWLDGTAKGCVFRGHVSAEASAWDGETVVIQKKRIREANSL